MDDEARRRFDHRWQVYPYEHPLAYWLRSDTSSVICTRCGGTLVPGRDFDLGGDPWKTTKPAFDSFVKKHLACKLGHGVKPARAVDPLLEAS